jgi:hypothetical protein
MKRICVLMSFSLACVLLLVPQLAAAQSEGIRVRGQWVIDVRDPDGTLAQHLEFDNALTPAGQHVLAGLLTGEWRIAHFEIHLGDSSGGFRMKDDNGATALVATRTNANSAVLEASLKAPQSLQINNVATLAVKCDMPCTTPPAATATGFLFTSHDLQVMSITAGQIVQAKVTLSFLLPPTNQ